MRQEHEVAARKASPDRCLKIGDRGAERLAYVADGAEGAQHLGVETRIVKLPVKREPELAESISLRGPRQDECNDVGVGRVAERRHIRIAVLEGEGNKLQNDRVVEERRREKGWHHEVAEELMRDFLCWILEHRPVD